MLSEGILIGSGLLDVPSVLGPLRMPGDIGNCKRLFTEQCSRQGLCIPVLVPALLSFSGNGALYDGRQELEEAVDSEDVKREVDVVDAVVFVDRGLLNGR